eukprot:INCI19118.2.p1 GENE.INCI19118.2~~INCI19118.2.p1  ORF type:complete len:109 (+),score=7.25 INCI19118.2:471-797(+)
MAVIRAPGWGGVGNYPAVGNPGTLVSADPRGQPEQWTLKPSARTVLRIKQRAAAPGAEDLQWRVGSWELGSKNKKSFHWVGPRGGAEELSTPACIENFHVCDGALSCG